MFCKKCGKQLADDSVFCKYCGTKMTEAAEEKTDAPVPPDQPQDTTKPFPWWIISIPAVLILSTIVLLLVVIHQERKADAKPVQEPVGNAEQEQETAETEAAEDTTADPKADPEEEETETDQQEAVSYVERQIRFRDAYASSYCMTPSKDGQTYEPLRAIDGNLTTAWLEGNEGLGIGESISVKFDKTERITRMVLYNGFLNSKYRYAINGKVKSLLIDFNDGTRQQADIRVMDVPEEKVPFSNDEMNPTEIVFDHPISASEMKLTILDAVPGTKYDDVCISEIELFYEAEDDGSPEQDGAADDDVPDAFESYFSAKFAPTEYGDYSVAFAYIDEDDIPEMVVEENFDMGNNCILQYSDGSVYETGWLVGGFSYVPYKNSLYWYETDGETGYEENLRISDHKLVPYGGGDAGDDEYQSVSTFYHTVKEAYQNIGR